VRFISDLTMDASDQNAPVELIIQSEPLLSTSDSNNNNNDSSNVTRNDTDTTIDRPRKPVPLKLSSVLTSSRWKYVMVDYYWHEKVLLVIDLLQVYGLVWVCSQPWPWPYIWVLWTRWSVAFNVDIFSLTPDGALAGRTNNIGMSKFGDLDGYLYYAVGFALVEIAVIGVAFYFYRKAEAYAKNWRIYQPLILYIGVYLATLFYLPCTLALFRLYVCESGSGILSADRHVTCGSAEHIVITVFCSLVHLPVIILTPTALYIWTKELCVYDLSPDHEKRLQMWEILYLMDVTNEYADNCCWAISSFKRKAAYFRCHMLLLKLGLACVFVGCRQNLSVQALLCVILISVFYGYYGLYRKTYRCWISSRMLTVAAVVLIVDTCFGFANSLGIKNFIMVASTESVVLLCVNVVGATALCVLLLLAFGCHRERIKVLLSNCDVMLSQWPAFLTLRNIAESPRLHALCLQWVAALRKANAIQLEVMTASHALLDIDGLETAIRDLRAHWLCASAVGSVFTVALSETLEELLELHTEMRSKALRTVNHWDDSFIVLAESHRFSHRHAHTLLMSDRKKRILTKLLALRTITSGAKINKDKDILRALSFKRRHSSFVVSRNLSPHSSLHSPVHSPNPLVQYLDQANHAMESQQFEELIDWIGELTTKSNTLLTVLQARGGLIGGNIESKPAESDGEVYMLLDDWEALINLFESYSYPRLNAHFSDIDVENWYTFRAALFETLPNVNEGVAEGSYANEANSNMFSQGSVDELDRLLGLHSGWNKFPFPEEGNDSGIQEV
jgi:hypothetical protein